MIYNSGKNIVLCVGPPVERPCQGDGGGGGGGGGVCRQWENIISECVKRYVATHH